MDRQVCDMELNQFDKEEKLALVDILNHFVYIDGNKEYVSKAIKIYSKSIFDALNDGELSQVRFYSNEL